MKHGLLLGLDGAGKTLLLRQLALQLLKNHKGLLDRLVALAQGASCLGNADALVPRGTSSQTQASSSGSSNSTGVSGTALDPTGTLAALSANSVIQNALQFASNHPSLAIVGGGGKEEKLLDHETQPTIGVEHTSLTIEGKTFSICEVGAQLLPMWKAYFDANDFWIYVIDISRPSHVAGAAIEFFNIMRIESMRRKPKLLLLNKIDTCFTMDDAMIRAYLCLDRLMTDAFSANSSSGPLHVLKISASSGENADAVLKWISQRWHNTVPASIGPTPSHLTGGGRVISFSKSEKQRVHPVSQQ